MLQHRALVGAQARAVVRRHQHQHRGTGRRGGPCARAAAIRVLKWLQVTITGTRPLTWRQAEVEQRVALVVGQQELLGVVGEDADAVDALVDHAVEHAALSVEVESPRRR